MLQVIFGLLSLGIIVFIHELGHFLAAKRNKVSVQEFAIGMGPVLFSYTHHETKYSIRAFPLGGFCRMKSITIPTHEHHTFDNTVTSSVEDDSFYAVKYSGKMGILMAGPAANIVLYAILLCSLFIAGLKTDALPPNIDPAQGSPAITAGLTTGDMVVAVEDIEVYTFTQMAQALSTFQGQTISLMYLHNDLQRNTTVTLNETGPALGVTPFISPVITYVLPNSLAEKNGIMEGDIIVSIDSIPIANAINIYQYLQNISNTGVLFTIQRAHNIIPIEILLSNKNSVDDIGIQFHSIRVKRWRSLSEFIGSNLTLMCNVTVSTFSLLKKIVLLKTKDISENAAGPIRIVSMIGNNTIHNIQQNGIWYAILHFLQITAYISLAVGIFNVLPIPFLDGGQALFYTYYRIRKKAPSFKTLTKYNLVGIILMLLMLVLIVFSDMRFLLG